ncbi:MAG: dTMP kinase [Pseudomonadales bacterium]|nr:dTMP kinase [Pseudomonadales bacterium]
MNTRQSGAGFIVIDGVDGAGKGVQSRLLFDAMQAQGLEVILSREPGGSPGAEEIRRLIVAGDVEKWDSLTELLLIYAARRSHLVDTIWPALSAGKWVISDRFADSSRAFQGVAGDVGLEQVELVHHLVVGSFKPDLTLILDLDPAISLRRAQQRGGHEDRFEKKGLSYQEKVRGAFRMLALKSPQTHALIDASETVEQVQARIFDEIKKRLGIELNR